MTADTERSDNLHRSIEAAKGLRLSLAKALNVDDGDMSADDIQTIQDTFDGETTLDAEIRRAVLRIEDDEIFVAGCKARETELRARRDRFEHRIEATRGLIEQAMTVAKWTTHEMDIGTVTIGKVAPRVEIVEESKIPTQFWKRAEPTLDKSGLRNVLKERNNATIAAMKIANADERSAALQSVEADFPPIDGCRLVTDGVALKIRRS